MHTTLCQHSSLLHYCQPLAHHAFTSSCSKTRVGSTRSSVSTVSRTPQSSAAVTQRASLHANISHEATIYYQPAVIRRYLYEPISSLILQSIPTSLGAIAKTQFSPCRRRRRRGVAREEHHRRHQLRQHPHRSRRHVRTATHATLLPRNLLRHAHCRRKTSANRRDEASDPKLPRKTTTRAKQMKL